MNSEQYAEVVLFVVAIFAFCIFSELLVSTIIKLL